MSFSEWKEFKLGDIALFKNGKGISDNLRCDNGLYSIYGSNGVIGKTNEKLIDTPIVIIGRVGAYCGSVQFSTSPCWVTDNAVLGSGTKKLETKYLYYFLNSFPLRNLAGGSAQPLINQKLLNNINLSIPTLEEQKAIVDILSALDDKIELNNQMNETLEEMAQSLFKRWFVDFEFPNEEGHPYKSSGGEMIESELGMIPKGWEVKRISDLIEVKDGTHASPKPVSQGYPLITSKHINGKSIKYNEANLISLEDYQEVNKRSKVNTGDILISMIGTVGLVHYVQEKEVNFAIKNLGLFKSSSNIDIQEYLYLYLTSQGMKNYIEARLAGTTQKYISLKELRAIPFIVPNQSLLLNFKKSVRPIFEMKFEKITENKTLTNIRDTLLPKLMSGEIRVSDLEE